MGLRDRVIEWLGAVPTTEIADLKNRAYEAGFYDGNDDPATGDLKKGGMGYRRHMSGAYVREGRIDYGRALVTAWDLWQKSPIAKRVLTMKRDHIIGHNAMPITNDDNLEPLLMDFWKANKLEKRASEFALQLFGFGEQCFPAFVRVADGRVLLGYIDPASIDRVVKHPTNALEDWAVVVKSPSAATELDKNVYRIIREDEAYIDDEQAIDSGNPGKLTVWQQSVIEPWEADILAEHGRDEYDGSCFYFKVNAVSNQARGMSDLLQVGDWVDQADEVLFSLADREALAGYFSFDVTLANADDEAIRQRAKELRTNPPAKGSVNAHNESEVWQMFAPELHQVGSIETFRAILGLILGGLGFPVHWFGYGDDANRATAVAQADPTTKTLEHDQGIVQEMLLTLCQFAADQAEIAGTYTPSDDTEIRLDLPEISMKDISRISASAAQLVMALLTAVGEGWLSKETAAQAFARVLAELDLDINVAEEMERAIQNQDERELLTVAANNGRLNQRLMAEPEIDGDTG